MTLFPPIDEEDGNRVSSRSFSIQFVIGSGMLRIQDVPWNPAKPETSQTFSVF